MNSLIIMFLAVVADIICIAVCAKAIVKDIRYNIRRYKLTRWASKMLELGRERREQLSIIPFEKPQNAPENSCEQSELPPHKTTIIPFTKIAM